MNQPTRDYIQINLYHRLLGQQNQTSTRPEVHLKSICWLKLTHLGALTVLETVMFGKSLWRPYVITVSWYALLVNSSHEKTKWGNKPHCCIILHFFSISVRSICFFRSVWYFPFAAVDIKKYFYTKLMFYYYYYNYIMSFQTHFSNTPITSSSMPFYLKLWWTAQTNKMNLLEAPESHSVCLYF